MRRAALLASVLLATLLNGAAPAHAARTAARVSYVSGGSVYLEAGEREGLRTRDTLDVLRGGAVLARIRVAYLSLHRASCDTLWTSAAVAPGDSAWFTPAEMPAPAPPAGSAPAARAPAAAHVAGLHGRLAARLLSASSDAGTTTQPALEWRLSGALPTAAPLDVELDLRARRFSNALSGRPDVVTQQARWYRASLATHTRDERLRFTLGRMASPTLAAVSLFDGAMLQVRRTAWEAGVFTGAQPDPKDLAPATQVVQSGAYSRWRSSASGPAGGQVTLGAATSSDHGEANRDFAFVRSAWGAANWNASFDQELDFQRGWKRARESSAMTPTGTYASVSLHGAPSLPRFGALPRLETYAGLDRRRNVLLWRDHETPETSFDDRFRDGAWLGLGVSSLTGTRLAGEARTSDAGDGSRWNGWSASLETAHVSTLVLALRARWSSFSGGTVENSIASLALDGQPAERMHAEVSGGSRRSRDTVTLQSETVSWVAAEADVTLPHGAYAHAIVQLDGGPWPARQVYAGVSWRY